MSQQNLFEDFPPIGGKTWREKVEADLKGADFEKRLVWRSDEGFSVLPYYRREDFTAFPAPQLKGKNGENPWLIKLDLSTSPEILFEEIKNAKDNGIQAIGIDLAGHHVVDADFIKKCFGFANPLAIQYHFSGITDTASFAEAIITAVKEYKLPAEELSIFIDYDPLGDSALQGKFLPNMEKDLLTWYEQFSAFLPSGRFIKISGGSFQESGSTLSQELAFALSQAVEYLDILTDKGFHAGEIMNHMYFDFVTGPDYFMEIGKLRAARNNWQSICESYGIDPVPMCIHTGTASWNQSIYDPYVNMLRNTTEAMSASLGGSDIITVNAFDSAYKEHNAFSSRMAKNLQIILKEEAYMDKVADPAAGSYYIESLTNKIADKSWGLFIEIEEKGGFRKALEKGFIQEAISDALKIKVSAANDGRRSILGVNKYPNSTEILEGQKLLVKPGPADKGDFKALVPFRISEDLEKFRLAVEKRQQRPKVFLLKYGDPVWMTARAMFSGNFFAVAGYEIIDQGSFKSIAEGITVAQNSGADIIVLCSSDDEYPLVAPEALKLLKEKEVLVIAGNPTAHLDSLQQAGLKYFIHVRSKLLETLKDFDEAIGN